MDCKLSFVEWLNEIFLSVRSELWGELLLSISHCGKIETP